MDSLVGFHAKLGGEYINEGVKTSHASGVRPA